MEKYDNKKQTIFSSNIAPSPMSKQELNRVIYGKLPSVQKKHFVDHHREVLENEQSRKIYNKSHADQRRGVKRSNMAKGDYALMESYKENKFSP